MMVISLKGKVKAAVGIVVAGIGIMLFGSILFSPGINIIAVLTGNAELKPVYRVDTDEKKIALTFDACWGAERTDKILATLDDYNIKSTFFLVNIWLNDYPEKAKEVAAKGHEIGLHSTTHPHFTGLSKDQMREELQNNFDMVKEVTGREAKLFRPPFGDYDNTVIETARDLGLTAIQWDVDSLDWRDDLSTDQIVERILTRVKNGSIILMHNDGQHTPEVIKIIIPELQMQGYSFVPVSDLLIKGEWYVDNNGLQRKK